ELLATPAIALKLRRQPIKQLGIRRRFPAHAKVLWRVDQATTEEVQPDLVHRDTRRQRILRRSNPAREVQSGGLGVALEVIEHAQHARLHLLAGPEKIAAHMDKGLNGIGVL